MEGFFTAIPLLDRCMMDRATAIEVVSDIVARAAEQQAVDLGVDGQQVALYLGDHGQGPPLEPACRVVSRTI